MSSLLRRRQRKFKRTNGSWEPRERPYRDEPGGYAVLHPTNGWQRTSQLRVIAQAKMRYMNETGKIVLPLK